MNHAYDPHCFCCDCCCHDDRLRAQVAAETQARRDERRKRDEAELVQYRLQLQLQTY